MKINRNFKEFKFRHRNSKNQIIYISQKVQNDAEVKNLIDNFLDEKNSFIFESVEKGKIILAEFGYGGKVMPTFPWDSTKPRRAAWFLKKNILPRVYWGAMFQGREWLTKTTKA